MSVDQQTSKSTALDTDALANTPCGHDPYDYVIVPGFVRAAALPAIHETYPEIDQPGSFPYQSLAYGDAFSSLLDELQGPEMRAAIEKVFDVDLTDRPTTVTVRGRCQLKDGRIHQDSTEKIITVLVYMNPDWEESGGRLRVLRSDKTAIFKHAAIGTLSRPKRTPLSEAHQNLWILRYPGACR